jgi:hypothetical protein
MSCAIHTNTGEKYPCHAGTDTGELDGDLDPRKKPAELNPKNLFAAGYEDGRERDAELCCRCPWGTSPRVPDDGYDYGAITGVEFGCYLATCGDPQGDGTRVPCGGDNSVKVFDEEQFDRVLTLEEMARASAICCKCPDTFATVEYKGWFFCQQLTCGRHTTDGNPYTCGVGHDGYVYGDSRIVPALLNFANYDLETEGEDSYLYDELCCECPVGTFAKAPVGADGYVYHDKSSVADGCYKPTCGDTDGLDTPFTCGAKRVADPAKVNVLLDLDDMETNIENCCQCDGDKGFVLFGDSVVKGCRQLTCENDNENGDEFPCHTGEMADGNPDPAMVPAMLNKRNKRATGTDGTRTDGLCCMCPEGTAPRPPSDGYAYVDFDPEWVEFGCYKPTCADFTCGFNMKIIEDNVDLVLELDSKNRPLKDNLKKCCECENNFAAVGGTVDAGTDTEFYCAALTCKHNDVDGNEYPCAGSDGYGYAEAELNPENSRSTLDRTADLCCRCPKPSFPDPVSGITGGCKLPTCGDVDGKGTNYRCGENTVLINEDEPLQGWKKKRDCELEATKESVQSCLREASTADVELCCACEESGGWFPKGGKVAKGCSPKTCSTINVEG